MYRPIRSGVCVCLAIVALLVPGCVPAVPNFVPATLTAALQFVADNAAEFTFTDTTPPVGENVTDVQALDGCWGRVADRGNVELPYVGVQHAQVLEVLHFDAAKGNVESDGLIREFDGPVQVLVIATGTFELLANSQLRMRLVVSETNDPSTGEIVPVDSTEVDDSTAQVQIAGDQLVLTYQPASSDSGATPHSVVYQRFTCP